MPTTSETHRIRIGIFQPILMHILRRKCAETYRGSKPGKRKHTAANIKGELFSWTACVSLSLAYCLTVLLLTTFGCVEKQPGPNTEQCNRFNQESMDNYFAQLFQYLHFQGATLSRQMEENFQRFGVTLHRIEDMVTRLKQDVCDNRTDINELQQTSYDTTNRLEGLEKELERMDAASRQSNLKFLGICESTTRNSSDDIDELVETLNDSSSSKTWERIDIQHHHRLGPANSRIRDQPRPLLVTFCRQEDRLFILRDKDLRDELRKRGIKVSADLTVRQRQQIAHYRELGKVAYFRNGRLHVQDSDQQQYQSRRTYHNTRSDNRHDNDRSRNEWRHRDQRQRADSQETRNDDNNFQHRDNGNERYQRYYHYQESADRQDAGSIADNWGYWRDPGLSAYYASDGREVASHPAYNTSPEMWNWTADMDYRTSPLPTNPHSTGNGAPTSRDTNHTPSGDQRPATDVQPMPAAEKDEDPPQEPVTDPSPSQLSSASCLPNPTPSPQPPQPPTPRSPSPSAAAVDAAFKPRETSSALERAAAAAAADSILDRPVRDAQAETTTEPETSPETAAKEKEADAVQQQPDDISSQASAQSAGSPAQPINDNCSKGRGNPSHSDGTKENDQTETDSLIVNTSTVEVNPDEPPRNPTRQKAGKSPSRPRDNRPKPTKTTGGSTPTTETRASRASRSQSQSSTATTRQASLHAAWQSVKDKTQK